MAYLNLDLINKLNLTVNIVFSLICLTALRFSSGYQDLVQDIKFEIKFCFFKGVLNLFSFIPPSFRLRKMS